MITRIEATRYRCFDKLDVELGEFRVLVGANGSGKTTLLDVPVLLGELLRERNINEPFTEQRGGRAPRATALRELIFQGQGDYFILAVEAALPERVTTALLESMSDTSRVRKDRWPTHIRYELRLQIFNETELQVQNEYLFAFSERHAPTRATADTSAPRMHGEVNPDRAWKFILKREYGGEAAYTPETVRRPRSTKSMVSPQQLAFPRMQFESQNEFPAARWLFDLLVEDTVFFDPDWNALRVASPPGLSKTQVLGSGKNAPWLALELQRTDADRFALWKNHVHLALPQVSDVSVHEREDDHHAYFRVRYGDRYDVPSSGLSDGTLRILVLTLLAYIANPKHSRDYGAAQHLYETLYGARHGAGQKAIEHLNHFFFQGHDKVTGRADASAGDLAQYNALKASIAEQIAESEQVIAHHFDPQRTPHDRPDRAFKTRELALLLEFYLERAERYGAISREAADEARYFVHTLDDGYNLAFTRSALVFDFAKPGTELPESEGGVEYHRIGVNLIRQLVDAAAPSAETSASSGSSSGSEGPSGGPRPRGVAEVRRRRERAPSVPTLDAAAFLGSPRDRSVSWEDLRGRQPGVPTLTPTALQEAVPTRVAVAEEHPNAPVVPPEIGSAANEATASAHSRTHRSSTRGIRPTATPASRSAGEGRDAQLPSQGPDADRTAHPAAAETAAPRAARHPTHPAAAMSARRGGPG